MNKFFQRRLLQNLTGKPKLFIIQACQGTEVDSGIENDMVCQKILVGADSLYVKVKGWILDHPVTLCCAETVRPRAELMHILPQVNWKVAADESFSHDSTFCAEKPRFHILCLCSLKNYTFITKEWLFTTTGWFFF